MFSIDFRLGLGVIHKGGPHSTVKIDPPTVVRFCPH